MTNTNDPRLIPTDLIVDLSDLGPDTETDDVLKDLDALLAEPMDAGSEPGKSSTSTGQERPTAVARRSRAVPPRIVRKPPTSGAEQRSATADEDEDVKAWYEHAERNLLARDRAAREEQWRREREAAPPSGGDPEVNALLDALLDELEDSGKEGGVRAVNDTKRVSSTLTEQGFEHVSPSASDSAGDADDELESLVCKFERSLAEKRAGESQSVDGDPAEAAGSDSTESSSPEAVSTEPPSSSAAPATGGAEPMRWTRDAFAAYRRLREARPLARRLSKRVFGTTWEPHPGMHREKNFPFFLKSLFPATKEKGCNALKEEWELSPSISPERIVPIPGLQRPDLPAWGKLPGANTRSAALREIIAGARFTSIAFRGSPSLQDWAYTLPGSDVLCLCVDLNEDAATRFLARENGDVGKSLKRDLLRRVDHRGNRADVTAAAIWTHPESEDGPAVRVFIMLQKDDSGAAHDVALVDRNNRFWHSLQRHGIQVSPSTMPLWVPREHLAPYLGLSEKELDTRWDSEETDWDVVADIQEFTPEEGFAPPDELIRRQERSYRKWARFTSRLGLPAWVSPEVIRLIEDYFFFPREHVSERKHLQADQKKHRHNRQRFPQRDRLALERLKLMELSPGEMCIFRCSPAQFAALAIRDGEVLGEYCDSSHKAGRARDLYEQIRREWKTD